MGKQYENDIVAGIDDNTPKSIKAHRCGYSGNNKTPQPDVIIRTPEDDIALELKEYVNELYLEKEDIEQLEACSNSYTKTYFVVKFKATGRGKRNAVEPIIIPLENGKLKFPEPIRSKETKSGNVRVYRPEKDEWPFSTETERTDWELLAEYFDLPLLEE